MICWIYVEICILLGRLKLDCVHLCKFQQQWSLCDYVWYGQFLSFQLMVVGHPLRLLHWHTSVWLTRGIHYMNGKRKWKQGYSFLTWWHLNGVTDHTLIRWWKALNPTFGVTFRSCQSLNANWSRGIETEVLSKLPTFLSLIWLQQRRCWSIGPHPVFQFPITLDSS